MLKSKPVPYEPFTPRPVEEPQRPGDKPEALTSTEIRERLTAREQSIREHVAALKDEVTNLDNVTVAGRPMLDHVRANPAKILGLAAAGGAVTGLLAGLVARLTRSEEDEEEAVMRLLVSSVLDEAALRVARGEDARSALAHVARRRAPVVHYAPPGPSPAGTIRSTFDLAVKSALGFAVKAGMDALSKQLTGTPEVFTAAKRASENPPGGPA